MAEEQQTIGTFEQVSFPLLKVSSHLIAKIDTGAYTGALHCTEAREEKTPEGTLLYFVPFGKQKYAQYTNDYSRKHVKSSNGHRQERFVITTQIVVRGRAYSIRLTLTDRSEMKYPALIGRRFLRMHKLMVDPAQYKK
ncbi:MAG TPA: RimK/LysX family protein [Candidatus Saccharibacteria bacterium]|nr:RimK/LysX family protein [Candidatus Saccharibacteria bacterium]